MNGLIWKSCITEEPLLNISKGQLPGLEQIAKLLDGVE